MDKHLLTSIIRDLVNSKREGLYWDFKEEPHDNNASLLHDIICLANCLHSGNRFLIIGISDPSSGCSVKGISKDQPNRKEQSHYIDFLRSKPFAGENRPEIEIHTVIMDGLEVDVIIVSDRPNKPYYLTVEYKDKGKILRANHIYTRTNDSNTPLDKSADISLIEKMWRQRFLLDLAPGERMKHLLLEPENWVKDLGNKKQMYHRQYSEYNIELSDLARFDEVYSFFFTNEKSFLGNALFRFNQTVLFEHEYMTCDEMRIYLPVPETAYLGVGDEKQWYHYYILDDLSGMFLTFLTEKQYDLKSRGSGAPFLIFRNKEELELFHQSLISDYEQLKKIAAGFWGTHAVKRIQQAGKEYMTDPVFLDQVGQYHEQWRLKKL